MADIADIYPPNRVSLREVGLRDGLQMVARYPDTKGKIAWIEQEYDAGIRHFEIGSFLPKSRYPEFADIDALIGAVASLSGASSTGLTPNKKGAENGFASGISEIHCVVSATEAHNQANLRRSQADTLREIGEICALRDQLENATFVGVGIAMSFGCPIAGQVDPAQVLTLAERCFDMGADMVSIADTVGFAGPKQVAYLAGEIRKLADRRPFGVHLHDTRGMGMANAAAALDQGVRVLDASLGGLGGCPAAPNATGNIVMEDLVFLCRTAGIDTGVDMEKLVRVRKVLEQEMPDEPLYGAMAKAGLPGLGKPAQ